MQLIYNVWQILRHFTIKLNAISVIYLVIFNNLSVNKCFAKYAEGHLQTLNDWAFVARFCFLSGKGQYEYHIEFERRFGEPQLLLYYDDKTQWPAVYKSGKTCAQKLSVLSVNDNQIVTLSARSPHNIISGCTIKVKSPDRQTPIRKTTDSPNSIGRDNDPSYFDQFLPSPTTSSSVTSTSILDDSRIIGSTTTTVYDTEFLDFNSTSINDTAEIFNATLIRSSSKVSYRHDIVENNNLENSTDFLYDIEELFTSNLQDEMATTTNRNFVRIKRSYNIMPVAVYPKRDRNTLIVSCENIGGFTSSRERWWYIAIANCGSGKGLDVKYKFKMTNGVAGDFWHEHFSADEMYIPPVLFATTISYSFLLLGVFICAFELKSLHLFHCTYRLFTLSTMLHWIGTLCQGVAWTKYALTGIGPYTTLGGLFIGASEVSFLALLLLMAKGYTITRARLSSCSTIKLTVFINIYIIVYIALFIYQAEAFDPGEVLNLYESPAGFGLTGLRICSWCAFLFSIGSTIRKYPEKRNFYLPFGLLGSIWILCGPFLTVIGLGVIDAWVRESMMCLILHLSAFGGHVMFLWLTWPSRANKSFPYHVRTNHVGIASDEDDGADYPRHTYAPQLTDQNIIIPLSRRTEELLNGVYNQYVLENQMYNSGLTPHSHISYPIQQTETISDAIDQENPIRNDDQIDSGHPSLENSSITPNETIPSNSVQQSPIRSAINNTNSTSQRLSTESYDDGILKTNPFIVNGVKRAPNKVILEPIEHPIRAPTLAAVTVASNVPKHLFAIKKA